MQKILVVDDSPESVRALARLLELNGHTVECAGNGYEALEVLGRFIPDSIILDLRMPVMDGPTFLATLREREEWRNIHVVVFTGCGDSVRADQLSELGVSEIFMKGAPNLLRLLRVVA